MAEIKSTMDLVMERAAKMAAEATEVTGSEEHQREGMRMAADHLGGKLPDLAAELAAGKPEARQAMQKGAVQTLLRNVVLPRDEMLRERSEAALQAIMTLAQASGFPDLTGPCSELAQILQQYQQHKEQVTTQVEDALRAQLEQQYAGRGVEPDQITASMHPQYAEEMAKMNQDLNGQYNQAMDQRKEMILQQIVPR